MKKYSNWRKETISQVGKFITFTQYLIFTVHLFASIWIWVGDGEEGWIKQKLVSDTEVHVYVASVYYVMTTFTTVGYGDITGKKNAE